MTTRRNAAGHSNGHEEGALAWQPPRSDVLQVGSQSRRWFLQAGLSGIAGLSTAELLRLQAQASTGRSGSGSKQKSVILFWLSGGPSHIDMWDPKPDATERFAGRIGTIPTNVPGVRFCEHLPAAGGDRSTS